MNTQRFIVFTDRYQAGWEYGTYQRAVEVAALIGEKGKVRVEERRPLPKGLWEWVAVDGPRKPTERRFEEMATTLPDDPAPPVGPQKKRAGVRSKTARGSGPKPKRGKP